MRKPLTIVAATFAVLALGAGAAAQNPPRPIAPPTIVIVEARPADNIDGAALFQAYCASCHGRNGKGDGPAARAIRTPVPDLTQIAAAHPGTDCWLHVLAELRTGHRNDWEPNVSRTDLDMPNWEPILRSMSSVDPAMGRLRLTNVSRYVASIQAK
jgi:mono/diheme cytochrome c family protein